MANDTMALQIADQLRREILIGDLARGAPIKERDNAAKMGVSRTPMREAIRILAQEGLVVLRPARSPIVAAPSLQEVLDEIAVLRALEVLACELAITRAGEEEIAQVARLGARIEDLVRADAEAVDIFDADMAFHRAIVLAARNPALAETHRSYLARLWRSRFLAARGGLRGQEVTVQHRKIVQALQARDAGAIRAQMAAHLDPLDEKITNYFEREVAGEGGSVVGGEVGAQGAA